MKSLLDATEREPMTPSQTEMMMKLMLMPGLPGAMLADMRQKSLAFAIIESRLEAVDAEVAPQVQVFISMKCKSPGDAVMWAYTLTVMYVNHGRQVDLGMLAEEFPMGFPTEKAASEIWDSQKQEGAPLGNGYDQMDQWPRKVA
jgi:hypothetical protein